MKREARPAALHKVEGEFAGQKAGAAVNWGTWFECTVHSGRPDGTSDGTGFRFQWNGLEYAPVSRDLDRHHADCG